MEQMSEAALADAHGPVIFSLAHALQALRVNDVDVANDVGAVVTASLDPYPTIDPLPNYPVQEELFAVVLVKLDQADVAEHV